jgi:prolyl oligopeptidase
MRVAAKWIARIAALACAVLAGTATTAQPLAYPPTQATDHTDTYFGTTIADPYRWLEDDNSAQTRAWVEAQNKLTFDYLGRIQFRADVLKRIRALSNYAKFSAPFRKNGHVYFYKNDGLQNQPVLYVQKGLAGTPEVLLDPNTFSADGTVRLTSFTLSRDGRYAVYGKTAIPGSDWHDLYVMEMATRRTLPEVLHWIKFSDAAWRGDGFYYSRFPEPARGSELTVRAENQRVYFHKIGTPQSADALVFEDPAHPGFFVDVQTTQDERFALLAIADPGKRGNSLFVRDEGKGEKAFRAVVAEITEDRFAVVDNVGDRLLILTNRDAPNRKLMRRDPARPLPADWATVLPERHEPLEGVVAVGGKLFATYLKDVTSQVQVFGRDGAPQNAIALPGPGTASGLRGEKRDTDVFYVFSSMNQPASIFRYDIASRKSTLFRTPEIPGFDATRFESHQVFFKSRDGTRVPMFVVHRKGLKLDGRNPTLLYGYGGFNVTMNPYFSATRIAWLEQGGVFALVNLRGGGEYGEAWHEAGMRLNKQNVFDDCIAAAEFLVREGYTAPDRLALQGGSNGGLLVGAVANQRPELFRVALPQVGVMDMLRFQKFSVGAAWVSDYGSSDDEAQFKALLGYSPLHNIRHDVNYPATLVTTSDHDDRVVPAHSFKYAATLQHKGGGDAPKLIRIETNSGHGSSNLNKALDEAADVYSFIWASMGIVPRFEP